MEFSPNCILKEKYSSNGSKRFPIVNLSKTRSLPFNSSKISLIYHQLTLPDISNSKPNLSIKHPILKKNKELNLNKSKDPEPESKSKPLANDQPENTSLSFIGIKLKIHSPSSRGRLKNLIRSQISVPSKVNIDILLDDDSSSIDSQIYAPPQIADPKVFKSSSSKINFNKKLKKSISKPNNNERKDKEDTYDPFHCSSMTRTSTFTSFKVLFDDYLKSHSAFPYLTNSVKTKPHPRSPTKIIKPRAFVRLKECICNTKEKAMLSLSKMTTEDIRKSLPRLIEIHSKIPKLLRVYYYPQRVLYFKNLVIFTFEGTLGYFSGDLSIKRKIWKVLRKFSMFFQLIIILPYKNFENDIIVNTFIKKKIKVAGVYTVTNEANLKIQSKQLLNYSQIFVDFDCQQPSKNCLLITSHKIADEIENPNDYIYIRGGTCQKLNANCIPVSSFEFPDSPVIVLLDDIRVDNECYFLMEICNDLETTLSSSKITGDYFDYLSFFKKFQYFVLESIVPHAVFMQNSIDNPLKIYKFQKNHAMCKFLFFCESHSSLFVKYPEHYPTKKFVINWKSKC